MDIEKKIQILRACSSKKGDRNCLQNTMRDAATALSTLQAENEQLRDELEQVKADRDAAIEYLREIEWCAGCKHFGGLDGCKKWAMGQCTEKHDLYEFIGPQKED